MIKVGRLFIVSCSLSPFARPLKLTNYKIMTIKKQREIISFFKETIKGVRGEYEKGWSPRSIKKDIETLNYLLVEKSILKNKKTLKE